MAEEVIDTVRPYETDLREKVLELEDRIEKLENLLTQLTGA